MRRPPAVAEALLGALIRRERRDEILGDLAEVYARRCERGSTVLADLWYWSQLVAVPSWLLASAVRTMDLDGGDLRRTIRGFRRHPGFALIAVVSLAVGIGATSAIIGTLRALLFTELPVERPDELALVYHTRPGAWQGAQYGSSATTDPADGVQLHSNYSYPAYESIGAAADRVVELAAFAFLRELSAVAGDRPAVAAAAMLVSGGYFRTLRLRTVLGRPLGDEDDQLGGERVVVLSHEFWNRVYSADPAAIGSGLLVNGERYEVVGVAEPNYVGLSPGGFFPPSDLTIPLAAHDHLLTYGRPQGGSWRTTPTLHWLRLIARVPASVQPDRIREALSSAFAGAVVDGAVVSEADAAAIDVRLVPGARGIDALRRTTQGPLRILSAVAVLVLLIACANLATLLLARGASRRHELAVRRALGASRWPIVRPLVIESLVLAVAGATLGVAIALWGGPILAAALTADYGRVAFRFRLDWVLASAAAGSACLAALLSAWLPALAMTRVEPGGDLKTRGQGASGARLTLGRGLIVTQIAVSVPLVVGAGLFLRTLGNLASVDPGFRAEDLVLFSVDPSLVTRDRERQGSLYEAILADVTRLPGVRSASTVENVLISGWTSNTGVLIEGQEHGMYMNAVGPDFFETMGVSVISGRGIGPEDGSEGPLVAVVNETAERTLFGGRALGRTFEVDGGSRRVVGVVADTKYSSLREDVPPTFFDSFRQRSTFSLHFVLRADVPAAALESRVREIVARADPMLPVTGYRTQLSEIEGAAARERIFARLLGIFGAFALALACIGLHGITAFSVARRTSEMGVRLALGARPVGIVRMVLRQVLGTAAVGLALGLLAARLVGPVVGSMLYGVEPGDASTMTAAALVMASVAVLAGWLPARRASRVDPLAALSPPGGG